VLLPPARFLPLDNELVLEDGVADDLVLRASRAAFRAARASPFCERPTSPEPALFVALSTRSSLAMFSIPFFVVTRLQAAGASSAFKRNGSERLAVAGAALAAARVRIDRRLFPHRR